MAASLSGSPAHAEPGNGLPEMTIGKVRVRLPIIQGGMGVGVSCARLAGAVSASGGLGTLSSACIDSVVGARLGRALSTREAMADEVRAAKAGRDIPVAVNIMVALSATYEDSVLGAMDGGAEVIISGAGLPLGLPAIVGNHPRSSDVELVPIVSSGRAAQLILKRWAKSGRAPSAMVVEGPSAGGHLGWRTVAEIEDPANALENLLAEVIEVSKANGNFPVIAAGGVYDRADIVRMLGLGAAGVQIGTRFLATEESGATQEFKEAVVACGPSDIVVAVTPGSPCQLPFRVLNTCGMYVDSLDGMRKPKCDKRYLLRDGKCLAKEDPRSYFCICNGLLSAAGIGCREEKPLYTVGSNAARVDRIVSVAELMAELAG